MARPEAGPDTLELVREGARILELAGCESPRLDAELLVAHALGSDRTGLVRDSGVVVRPDLVDVARELIRRRSEREPVAQITGSRHFRRLELFVDSRVLSPRPETELLVEWGIGLPHGARVVDVGTGSGAIALALADERPDLDVTAVDIDGDALAVAAINVQRLGLEISLIGGDLLGPVVGSVDAVVSNPPYLSNRELERLEPEVVRYEPTVALACGEDALATISRLVDQASSRDVPAIALEVGIGQADEVEAMLSSAGWTETSVTRDLAGIARVVSGRGR